MKITSVEDVIDLRGRLRASYSEARNQWKHDRNLYYFDHYYNEDEAQPGEERIMINAPTNVVDLGYSILAMNGYAVQVLPIKPDKRRDKKGGEVEKFLKGLIYTNNMRYQADQIALALFDQCLYGRGILFSGWDEDYEGEEDSYYYELPLVLRHERQENVMCLYGGRHRYLAQMYSCMRRIEDVEAEWDVKISPPNASAAMESQHPAHDGKDEVLYADLWWYKGVGPKRRVWHCIMAGDQWLKAPVEMKYYKRLPYTEFLGRVTTSDKLHNQYLGLLYPMRESVSMAERFINQMATIVALFSDPMIVAAEDVQIQKGLGAVIKVPVDVGQKVTDKVHLYPPSNAASGLYKAIEMMQGQISQGSFSPYAYATASPESGPVAQLMNSNDRVRLQTFKANAQMGLSLALQKCIDVGRAFAESDDKGPRKIQVLSADDGRGMVEVDYKDLTGWYIHAKLSDQMPTDRARDVAVAANAKQSGLPISTYTLQQDYLNIEQPEDEMRRLMIEKFMADEEMQQLAKQIAMEEVNQKLREKYAPGLEEMETPMQAQPGQPGMEQPGMMPPAPTGPPTTAVSPQGMGQPFPPEALQQRGPPGAPGAMQGAAPGAPTGMGP